MAKVCLSDREVRVSVSNGEWERSGSVGARITVEGEAVELEAGSNLVPLAFSESMSGEFVFSIVSWNLPYQ